MARKCRNVGFGDMKRAQGGDGRGPWEVSQYVGPSEALIDDSEAYQRMIRQHLGNEKRRICHRLKEIKRYKFGQTWVGLVPSEEELEWWDWEDRQMQARRLKRSNRRTGQEDISTTEDDEEPLMRRRKRLRRNNEAPPPPPPSDVMPPVPEYASEDIMDLTDIRQVVKDEDLHSVPETVLLEDEDQCL